MCMLCTLRGISFWGFLEFAKGGGQNVSCDFGGENVLYSAPSKPSFGGLRKWDLSGLCPFPLRKMTLREQRGGGSYHKWGGPKPFLGRGLGFYGMFSPPLSFPPPLSFFGCWAMYKNRMYSQNKNVLVEQGIFTRSGCISP